MKEFTYTKKLAIIVGLLTILSAFLIVALSLLGIGLSNALSGEHTDWSKMNVPILMAVFLFIFGIFTSCGVFIHKSRGWKALYIVICFTLGTFGMVFTCIAYGALGFQIELFLFFMSILYLTLAVMAKKKL